MEIGKASGWKTAIVASGIALASQASLADNTAPKENMIDESIAKVTQIVSGADLIAQIGAGGLVCAILGGGGAGYSRMRKGNKRKALRREIADVITRFRSQTSGISESYLRSGTHLKFKGDILDIIAKLEGYTDEQIDKINIEGGRARIEYERSIKTLGEDVTKSIRDAFAASTAEVKTRMMQVNKATEAFVLFQRNLKLQQGYKFKDIELPTVEVCADPNDTIRAIEFVLRAIEQQKQTLDQIVVDYNSLQGIEIQVDKEFKTKKVDLQIINANYATICAGSDTLTKWQELGTAVGIFLRDFQVAYKTKDIDALMILAEQKNELINAIRNTVRLIQQDLIDHKDIQSLINKRGENMKKLPQYVVMHIGQGDRREFVQQIVKLNGALDRIRDRYRDKSSSMGEIQALLESFDRGYNYIIERIPATTDSKPPERIRHTIDEEGQEGNGFKPTEPMSF